MKRILRIMTLTLVLFGMANIATAVPPSPGDYVVTDQGSGDLFGITPAGVVTSIAAGLAGPSGVVIDSSGDFIVAERNGNQLLRVTSTGVVSTIATGFNQPVGVAIDASGNFIVNTWPWSILSITPGGVVTTIASGPIFDGLTNSPAIDSGGDIIVADVGSLKRVTLGGIVTTITSGPPLVNPTGVVIDAGGDFIVGDRGAGAIFRITPTGVVSTIAIVATPYGLGMDKFGNFIVGTNNAEVVKVTPAGVVTTVAIGLPLVAPNAVAVVPAAPTLFISPTSGKLVTTQQFDLVLMAEGGIATIVSADLDGTNVTGPLSSCVVPGTLIAPAGSTLSCSITGATIGGGTHTLTVTADINGTLVTDSATWIVHNATQP